MLFDQLLWLVDLEIIDGLSFELVVVKWVPFVGVLLDILVLENLLALSDASACFFSEGLIFIFDLGIDFLNDGKGNVIESAPLVLAAIPH